MPDATINLAFHFEADSLGNNFICDPNDPFIIGQLWSTWYAPTLVNSMLNVMNVKMSSALLLNSQNEDAKIKFKLYGNGTCGQALFTYAHGDSLIDVPGAMNIYFKSDKFTNTAIGGAASLGGDFINMNDIINEWVNTNNNPEDKRFWIVANTLSHEFGHTRSLKHTFHCSNPCNMNGFDVNTECNGNSCINNSSGNPPSGVDCVNGSKDNLIMSYNVNSTNFTECEFGEMWNYMLNNTDDYQEIETCDLPENNDKIIYDENSAIVWSTKKIFTKHVVIKSGTTVTVNCEVQMGDDKEIVVEDGAKLIVEGGTITSICEKPWRGIKVYGGSDSYAVEIKGGSTIENSSQGAVSMFHDGGWLLGDGNAHVLIQGSTFNDCNRILGMGSVMHETNFSKVEGNVQNGGKYGVTNWNCLNVSVIDNVFNDISISCVVSSGQMVIKENEFRSNVNDVLFPISSPTMASEIEDNDFYGNGVGLRIQGVGIAEHKIIFNIFHSNWTNIRMEGDNNYLIAHNEFDGYLGATFINNGSHLNLVNGNNIDTDIYGFRAFGDNSGFVINNNCYQTNNYDNYITGVLNTIQGAINGNGTPSFRPANNCFTHQGAIAGSVEDLYGSTNNFFYIEPDDMVNDCRDAVKAEPNIQIEEIGESPIIVCVEEEGGTDDPCRPSEEIEDVNQALNELNTILDDLVESDIEYDSYLRCYETVRGLWIELMLEQDENDQVRDYLSSIQGDDSKLLIYQSYLNENDLLSAEQYLKSMTDISEQLDDFRTIQLIELKRLNSNLNYEVSDVELSVIYNIAHKNHPYSAYGKSLYFWITEELLSTNLPPIDGEYESQERRLRKEMNSELKFDIFPNPFDEKLHIEFQNISDKKINISIYDILGKKKYEKNTHDPMINVNTSTWDEGVYLIRIYDNNRLLRTEKLILSK